MSSDAFAKYDGPLCKETILGLSGPQIRSFGSMMEEGNKICESLELQYAEAVSFAWITSRCLYGYLSRKRGIGLEERWRGVPTVTLEGFTTEMQSSWSNIEQGDFIFMPRAVRRVVFGVAQVCTSLELSYFLPEIMKDVSGPCLHAILSRPGSQVLLKSLWQDVELRFAVSFTDNMMTVLKRIDLSEFTYMPALVLKRILGSQTGLENLPQPTDDIILSTSIAGIKFNREQFSAIIRAAPNIAGQLLLLMEWFPVDILADCDGYTLRTLKFDVPGQEKLTWTTLIDRLEEKLGPYYYNFVSLISINSQKHLCATITDSSEYLSLLWLRRNMNANCRSEIAIDLSKVFIFLDAPELATKDLPWERLLNEYSKDDWATFSANPGIITLLGENCEFWATINAGHSAELFKAFDREIWKSITPDCVLKLDNILSQNVELVALLADDAFSKHQLGQLPCHLANLSPAQICRLSKGVTFTGDVGLSEEGTFFQHILSEVTLNSLKALNLQQFKSFYESQWKFIPKDSKKEILNWHLQLVQSRISIILKGLKKGGEHDFDFAREGATALDNVNEVKDMIGLILMVYGDDSHQKIVELNLHYFIPLVKDSELQEACFKIFQRTSPLNPVILGLVRNAEELRSCNHKSIEEMNSDPNGLLLSHDLQFGFDRYSTIELLENFPEAFAAPRAKIISEGLTDSGGPMMALVGQLFNDIERDLVVAFITQNLPATLETSENLKERLADVKKIRFTKPNSDIITIESAKFIWGISRKVGSIVGLVFGKALQLDIRLPFVLDPAFYDLLVDNSDESIEAYYKKTYSQEVSKFERDIMNLFTAEKFEELLYIIPRPENLRFTELSLKVDDEEAKSDVRTRTNLWACHENECYENVSDLTGQDFPKKYINSVLTRVWTEFKGFIFELVKGLEMSLPLVKRFKSLPTVILRPFSEFLPILFNPEPIRGEQVLSRIEFYPDQPVESLIQGKTILVSKVITAFILSLEQRQLAHLIGIWTGTSTLSLKYSKLKILLIKPANLSSYQVNFCDPVISSMKNKDRHHLITSGEEYQEFFKKFVGKLLGPGINVDPDCSSGGVSIVPARVSTCAKSLIIYLQSTEQILNSLVDLLYTRLTTLWDNQQLPSHQ